jgi:hypothetical protein
MIVNKQILIEVGACEESVTHFINLLGNGNEFFEMSLDDAIYYLQQLEQNNPDNSEFTGWTDFVRGLAENPIYIKLNTDYTLGKYVLSGNIESTDIFDELESAIAARNLILPIKVQEHLQKYNVQQQILLVQELEGAELLVGVDSPITDGRYLVFNPSTGFNTIYDSFTEAQEKIIEYKTEIMRLFKPVSIGQQIILDGKVIAIDHLQQYDNIDY